MLAAVALTVVSPGAPAGAAHRHAGHRGALTAAPPCPAIDYCATLPGNATVSSGTVELGPATGLGANQWVYVNGYGFAPGSVLHILYCSDAKPLTVGSPLCVTNASATIAQGVYVTKALSNGEVEFSFQVAQASTVNAPLTGTEPGVTPVRSGTFLCDTATPCSVDVTNLGNGSVSPLPTPKNTAVLPVSFAPATNGCGSSATSVTTESEFGIELILPIVSRDSCKTSRPVLAFNAAFDGYQALAALNEGTAEVAFTDDPEATDQQDLLKQGNFKLIPVALTANVIGFRGEALQNSNFFPLNTLDLTPTMAAGMLTGIYTSPPDTDQVVCAAGTCPIPPCTARTKHTRKPPHCSLYTLLDNQVGFSLPNLYNPYVRSDQSGSTGLLFSWLCHAPVVPVHVTVVSGKSKYTATQTESTQAAKVLEYGLGSPDAPVKSCPTTDQYPPLPVNANGRYEAYDDPDQQSIKMATFVPTSGASPRLAVSSMNWAEARYYGLAISSIQNAGGKFVLPTPQSLDDAVALATKNADGTITPNYTATTSTAAASYPMTSVLYAAVCGDARPTSQASAVSALLDQILDVTGGTDSTQLPQGFVPLTSTLLAQAQSDISSDVIGGGTSTTPSGCPVSTAPPPSPPTTTPTTTPTTIPATVPSTTSAQTPTGPPGEQSSPASHTVPASSNAPTTGRYVFPGLGVTRSAAEKHGATSSSTQLGRGVVAISLVSSPSRVLLPISVLLGFLGVVVGALLLLSAELRRHTLAAVGTVGKAGSAVWGAGRKAGRVVRSWMGVGKANGRPW
jgi:hypothetical protein